MRIAKLALVVLLGAVLVAWAGVVFTEAQTPKTVAEGEVTCGGGCGGGCAMEGGGEQAPCAADVVLEKAAKAKAEDCDGDCDTCTCADGEKCDGDCDTCTCADGEKCDGDCDTCTCADGEKCDDDCDTCDHHACAVDEPAGEEADVD